MNNSPTSPDQPEAPAAQRGKRSPNTNTSGLTGWAFVADKLLEKVFAPSFLSFILVGGALLAVAVLISGTVELDRILKGWAFIGPLVGGYVGHAFTKTK